MSARAIKTWSLEVARSAATISASRQGKRERCRCTIVVTPCGRGSRPGGGRPGHATRSSLREGRPRCARSAQWWFQVGMVSLPGWGGRWERRVRLGSDGSEISKKRYFTQCVQSWPLPRATDLIQPVSPQCLAMMVLRVNAAYPATRSHYEQRGIYLRADMAATALRNEAF